MTPPRSTTAVVEAFIREIGGVKADDIDFSPSVDLFDYGYLDSFGIVNLIERVQGQFGFDMTSTDFYGDNIRTVRDIAAYIDAHCGVGAPGAGTAA